MKLGLIAFSNNSGLGNQSRRLIYMLKPYRLLVVNASGFSRNKEQHNDWYDGFTGYKVNGFPTDTEVRVFLKDLTHVLVCENPLNFSLLSRAKSQGTKVYIQSNYEFCDHLREKNIELPTKFLMPSYWHMNTMKELFGEDKVMYLPPPIDPSEFKRARETNFNRKADKVKLLHVIGTLAAEDRNGTLDLLKSLDFTTSNFELTIRSQHELPEMYLSSDSRVKYIFENAKEPEDMYMGFDALILPRRYGGLSLTTNEALMSGLPVLMTDISPNDELLPKGWLFKANIKKQLYTRTWIDVYESQPEYIASKIDWLIDQDLEKLKVQAFDIGYNNFSDTSLKPKYDELFT